MPELTVDTIDNRGGDQYMFGFVYFNDGRRVAYATGHGVVSDATGGWEPITRTHEKLAQEYLDENYPGWNEEDGE